MTAVLALDLSATKAGVALPDGSCMTLTAPKVDIAKKGRDEIGRRLWWWDDQFTRLFWQHQPAIVAVEDYAPRAPGMDGRHRTAEVRGIFVVKAMTWDAAIVDDIGPGTLKKWATGNGNAGKDAMIAEARRRGATVANDDEADAWLLRAMVMEMIG